jgi:hypothetical protein
LLRAKLSEDGKGAAVWLPRVYRILDSMADFDPAHVQRIRVSFRSTEPVPEFVAWLPNPDSQDLLPAEQGKRRQEQDERKRILAHYLATKIYNFGVVRRVFAARFECDEPPGPNSDLALTNGELQKLAAEAELAYGQRAAYRAYLESFNFESFTIKAGEQPDVEAAALTADVIKDPQCLFLGIDIGGTDVKFCLSLIKSVHKNLKRPGETWPLICAIGISWPGAVRDSHLVSPSGTLANLTSEGKRFSHQSPPADIHALDLAEIFLAKLGAFARRRKFSLKVALVCTIVNHGNAQRMKYKKVLEARKACEEGKATEEQKELANHPVGSGAIESACRQYQCRFKRTGQFWTTPGDEALMCLETLWRNGRWDQLYPPMSKPQKNRRCAPQRILLYHQNHLPARESALSGLNAHTVKPPRIRSHCLGECQQGIGGDERST